uniref:Choline transporter-like protein n=1 Tax=Syphacia muris TaxID=451379 RepID=A0A0N5ABS5_9BILA
MTVAFDLRTDVAILSESFLRSLSKKKMLEDSDDIQTSVAIKTVNNAYLSQILNGHDSWGNICGKNNVSIDKNNSVYNGDMSDKSYALPLFGKLSRSAWICVHHCPLTTAYGSERYHLKRKYMYCFTPPNSTAMLCPRGMIKNSRVAFSYCFPDDIYDSGIDSQSAATYDINHIKWLDRFMAECRSILRKGIQLCCITIALSLAGIIAINFFASMIIYFVVGVVTAISYGISIFFWIYITKEEDNLSQSGKATLLTLAIITSCLSIMLTLAICYAFPRIRLVVDLLCEAGKAFRSIPSLFLQPFITFIGIVIVVSAWIFLCLCVLTSGTMLRKELYISRNETMNGIAFKAQVPYIHLIVLFTVAMFWLTEFIFACGRMLVAYTIINWYFERDILTRSYLFEVKDVISYHVGSLAFGSLFMTIFKIPRYCAFVLFIRFFLMKTRNIPFPINLFVSINRKLVNLLTLIHHNAYTVVAMKDENFLRSAKIALNVLSNKSLDFTTINVVADLILYVANFAVVFLAFVVCVLTFKVEMMLQNWLLISILFTFFAYLIASCFFGLVEMVVDTLFLVFSQNEKYVGTTDHIEYYNPGLADVIMMNTAKNRRKIDRRIFVQDNVYDNVAEQQSIP